MLHARGKQKSRINERGRATEYMLHEAAGQDHWKGDIVSKM